MDKGNVAPRGLMRNYLGRAALVWIVGITTACSIVCAWPWDPAWRLATGMCLATLIGLVALAMFALNLHAICLDLERKHRAAEWLFDFPQQPILVFDYEPDGSIGPVVHSNTGACHRLGYSPEDLLGLPVQRVFEGMTEETRASLGSAIERRGRLVVERSMRTRSGETIPVEVEWYAEDPAGERRLLAIVRDRGDRGVAERAVRGRDRKLAILSSASRRLYERLDVEEVLDQLVRAAMEVVGATHGRAGLVTGDELVFRPAIDMAERASSIARYRYGEGIPGRVWDTMTAYITNDAPRDPLLAVDDRAPESVLGLVAVPVIDHGGRLIGCLEVYDRADGRPFDDEDALFLTGLGASAAIAIENALIVDELKVARTDLLAERQMLRSLTDELARTEDRERRRLATELHDSVGQTLTIARMKAAQTIAESGPEASPLLHELRDLLDRTIADTRSLMFEISPPLLYEIGLDAALEWLCEQTEERHGLQTTFTASGPPCHPGEDVRSTLYACTRELMFNTVKHAKARRLDVSVMREEALLVIHVEDDGVGFRPEGVPDKAAGFGLFSVSQRLQGFGGTVDIRSQPKGGTRVKLQVPIP